MRDLILLFSSAVVSSGLAGTVVFLVAKLAFKQAVADAIETTVENIYDQINKLSEDVKGSNEKITARIDRIYSEISDLKDNVQENYVTCKFCEMQHENVSAMHKAINAKLDVIIGSK